MVSSSANTEQILEAAGITHLFDARVDGVVIAREHLKGKPAPDSFLRGAELLGAGPPAAAVFEDAQAGVAAGRAGGFGLVVGVARNGDPQTLLDHGDHYLVTSPVYPRVIGENRFRARAGDVVRVPDDDRTHTDLAAGYLLPTD